MVQRVDLFLTLGLLFGTGAGATAAPAPRYVGDIEPIFRKYCVGCHNAEDREGELDLSTYQAARRGGETGPVLIPGKGRASRMIRLLTGQEDLVMPPEDERRPTDREIGRVIAWIDAGAPGPTEKEPPASRPDVPHIEPANGVARAVTAIAFAPDGNRLAVARFRIVEIVARDDLHVVRRLEEHPGKIMSLAFTADGRRLVVASGVAGLRGEVDLWDLASGQRLGSRSCHTDLLYAAVPNPAGTMLATAGYDRQIILYRGENGAELHRLTGHNGAIFDVAFTPDGAQLASASGDATIKLWDVATGERIDTFGQPTKEQYTVAIAPDGSCVVGGGADRRIRVWDLSGGRAASVHPLLYSRFAHDGAVLQLAFSRDGRTLVSSGQDRMVKLWDTRSFTVTHIYPPQPDLPAAVAIAPDATQVAVGRMDGSLQLLPIPIADGNGGRHVTRPPGSATAFAPTTPTTPTTPTMPTMPTMPTTQPAHAPAHAATAAIDRCHEREPNDTPGEAMRVRVPVEIVGTIGGSKGHSATKITDCDWYRFETEAGRQWVVSVRAAEDHSPLDSVVEVLDAAGKPIVRYWMQAVRDSYLTFRGKDSTQSSDFRLKNWEEMNPNDYLYLQGEVVKLYQYPRGPDSGFWVFPGNGPRWTYFDTTATTHALNESCYIVRPYPADRRPAPNGLPLFPIYARNDDDSTRKGGTDSRLMFHAERAGTYLVRVSDARGFAGDAFHYRLQVRPPRPAFVAKLDGTDTKIAAGSGQSFAVTTDRIDDFAGEVRIDISGLPRGFSVTTPVIIEAGHRQAWGTIHAAEGAISPSKEAWDHVRVTATALIGGEAVRHDLNTFGPIEVTHAPPVRLSIDPAAELVIAPGHTVPARLIVDRHDFTGRVRCEALNLPHGVYVDNIGLNGILIPEGERERTVRIKAAPWVRPTVRPFFMQTKEIGQQTSRPVLLRVAETSP